MPRNPLVLFLIASAVAAFAQAPSTQSPVPAPAPISTQGVLSDGTAVRLRLVNVSAPSAVRVGDILELEVVEPVRVRNVVVIPAGSVAKAVVTNPQSKMSSGREGEMDVNFLGVALSDDSKVGLRGGKQRRTDLTVVASSGGQDVSIARDREITAYIDGDSTLDLVKLQAANRPTTVVKIASNPPNAEISVDGRAVGNTPFVMHLPTGEHAITLRQAGYQPWRQNIHVAAEPVSLDVALLKQDGMESTPPANPAPISLGEAARAARARKAAEPASTGDANAPAAQAPPQN
ncbi:MAG TPA: PEGA domain-containing protein [Terriglobales bacterium]|nr:PEGA domain-containing protein [Terriglobales bacterium]